MKNILKIAVLSCLMGCSQLSMPAAPTTTSTTTTSTTNAADVFEPISSVETDTIILTINENRDESLQVYFQNIQNDPKNLEKRNKQLAHIKIIKTGKQSQQEQSTIPTELSTKLKQAPMQITVIKGPANTTQTASATDVKDQKTAAAMVEVTLQSSGNNSPASSSPYSSATRLLQPSRLQRQQATAITTQQPITNSVIASAASAGSLFNTAPITVTSNPTIPTVATAPQLPIMRRSSSPTAARSTSPFALCKCDGFSCQVACGKCSCGPCCKPLAIMPLTSISTAVSTNK